MRVSYIVIFWIMTAVLFDFGGTLDSNGIAWKDSFLPIYRKYGVRVAQEKFDRAFYDADDYFHVNHAVLGMGFAQTVTLQVRDVFKNLALEDAAAAKAVAEEFLLLARANFRAIAPALDALAEQYRLGVVSNFYGNMEAVLESEGLDRWFKAAADSRAVGVEKPDAKLFSHALEKLGEKAAGSVMVGDNIKRDMAGAANIGMTGALLWGDRFAQGNPPPQARDCIVLKNLSELPALLQATRTEAGRL